MPRNRPNDFYQGGDRKTPVNTLLGLTRQLETMRRRQMWMSAWLFAVALAELLFAWWVVNMLRR